MHADGGSALARCVGDPQSFVEKHWGQRAHLHHTGELDDVLNAAQVDEIISTMALRAPAFRLVQGGATLPASSYTRRARIGSRTITDLIDVGRVYDHFNSGATIVLQGLHRYWSPVGSLCRQLERELTHQVQANAYITPPVAQGLRVHADPHDVFAIQTHGAKQWVLYEGDQSPAPDGSAGTTTLDTQLTAGDCLYVPKGVHHAARTVDTPSIHLTIGVKTVVWRDVLQGAVEAALEDATLKEPLPPGFANDPAALAAGAAQRLRAVAAGVEKADAEALVASAARRFWSARVPSLQGQLQQLLADAEITDATRVRRRPDATAHLTGAGDRVVLVLGDRSLRMPSAAADALRQIIERDSFAVGELAGLLDQPGRATLVRRLVREGLLLVVDD